MVTVMKALLKMILIISLLSFLLDKVLSDTHIPISRTSSSDLPLGSVYKLHLKGVQSSLTEICGSKSNQLGEPKDINLEVPTNFNVGWFVITNQNTFIVNKRVLKCIYHYVPFTSDWYVSHDTGMVDVDKELCDKDMIQTPPSRINCGTLASAQETVFYKEMVTITHHSIVLDQDKVKLTIHGQMMNGITLNKDTIDLKGHNDKYCYNYILKKQTSVIKAKYFPAPIKGDNDVIIFEDSKISVRILREINYGNKRCFWMSNFHFSCESKSEQSHTGVIFDDLSLSLKINEATKEYEGDKLSMLCQQCKPSSYFIDWSIGVSCDNGVIMKVTHEPLSFKDDHFIVQLKNHALMVDDHWKYDKMLGVFVPSYFQIDKFNDRDDTIVLRTSLGLERCKLHKIAGFTYAVHDCEIVYKSSDSIIDIPKALSDDSYLTPSSGGSSITDKLTNSAGNYFDKFLSYIANIKIGLFLSWALYFALFVLIIYIILKLIKRVLERPKYINSYINTNESDSILKAPKRGLSDPERRKKYYETLANTYV